ncbi:MAG TPA: hypothetical protein VFZ66_12150 [Herpetosiphonaceae bacterium]
MRTKLYSLLALLALSMLAWPSSPSSAAAPQPVYQYGEKITPATGEHKSPSAATAGGQLHVVWSAPNAANYATRAEQAQVFAIKDPPVGSIGSNSTYFNNSVAVDKNGVIHAVWIDSGSTIRHSSKTGDTWSAVHTAATGQNFANNLASAAASTGRLFAAWRHQGDPDGNISFIVSDNGGASWSAPIGVFLPTGTYAGMPRLAGGPSGQMYLTWTGVDGNVYVGEYNGVTFTPTKITSGTNFFNSTVSVMSNGQPVAAWRNADNGVYYGYRTTAGQWVVQKVFAHGGVTGPATIVADAQDNLHLAWVSQQAGSGMFETWYSFKTPADPWSAPMVVSREGTDFKTNVNMAVSLSGGTALAHIVWESFQKQPPEQFIRYAQIKTQVSIPLAGSLTINGGAPYTNQPQVNVSISNTSTGQATAYSLADGIDPGAPSAPFSNPMTNTTLNLNVTDGQCRAHTVYGRLGNGTSTSPVFAATITYDPFARIIAQARNPNSTFNQPLNDFNSALVPSGEIGYTREERFNLSVVGAMDECTGIKRYAIVKQGAAKPGTGDPAWRAITGGYVSANVQFNATSGQGTYDFDVYAHDLVDNETTTPTTVQIIYDTQVPTYTGATTPLPATTSTKGGIATITVGSPTVSDNLYPGGGAGKQYWGYWVVVKQSSAAVPTTAEWESYGVIKPGELPSTLRWNMADGLVGSFQRDANYTVYIRYLDGAGNASAPMSSQPLRVGQLEYFTHLPLSSR